MDPVSFSQTGAAMPTNTKTTIHTSKPNDNLTDAGVDARTTGRSDERTVG